VAQTEADSLHLAGTYYIENSLQVSIPETAVGTGTTEAEAVTACILCPEAFHIPRSPNMSTKALHYLFFGAPTHEGRVVLDSNDSRHATKVLRLRPGERIRLTDGAGMVYDCRLQSLSPHRTEAIIDSARHNPPAKPRLVLVVGLPERDGFETLLEQVTALGAADIVPAVCDFCQNPWWETKWAAREERFRKKMIGAIKQALSPYLPALHAPANFSDAVGAYGDNAYVADEHGTPVLHAAPEFASRDTVVAFIGPPGGFSPRELDTLRARNAHMVSLSANRLRTELAATALSAIIMAGAAHHRHAPRTESTDE
jgi:16S rRNA (uracil1498-N3)-methyltransferase